MAFSIRPMAERHIRELYEIGQECGLGSWSQDAYKNEYKNPIAQYLVVEKDGQAVGFAGIWCVVDEAQVMNVGIKKSVREQGLGTKLLKALIQLASAEGCSTMTLEVKQTNTPALTLYKKMGFKTITVRKGYYSDHVDGVIMRRDLYG